MIQNNNKENIYICAPDISIGSIIKAKRNFYNSEIKLYYHTFSNSLKFVIKLFNFNEDQFISYLSSLGKLTIIKIGDSDTIKDYLNIQFDSMEQTTKIVNLLIPELVKSRTYRWLAKLIGNEPAEAFIVKNISHFTLFPNLLALNLCNAQLNYSKNIILISDFFGSNKWVDIFQKNFDFTKIISIKESYFSLSFIINFIYSVFISLFLFFKFIIIRGITFSKVELKKYKLINEFIDPKKLNGECYDADYFIKNSRLNYSDVIFFLTHSQRKILESNDYNMIEIKNIFFNKKYNLIVLDDIKYSINSLMDLFKKLISLIFYVSYNHGNKGYYKILNSAWEDYLDYLPLFNSVNAESLLYYTFPNGKSTSKFNDGLITGFCRKSEILSIGIQSRTIYTTKYEDCFDCFDRYLSWGEKWDSISVFRTKYINEIKHIGCIYLDVFKNINLNDLALFKKRILNNKKILVSVFDTDISPHSHHTWMYAKQFMLSVMNLANEYQDCKFVIKVKDISNKDLYLKNPTIYSLHNKNDNIIFIDNERNDYNYIINASDIVISIGYTTPGFEALSLGKRIIYYSLLKNGGKAFKILPNVIASNYNKLKELFIMSLRDRNTFFNDNKSKIKLLNYSESKQPITNFLINFN